jgi:hypothetical protein
MKINDQLNNISNKAAIITLEHWEHFPLQIEYAKIF